MANGYYRDVIIDNYGRPLTGVTITVYLTGTLTLATLYSNRAGSLSLANPFTNESGDGSFEFWADTANRYDIAFSKSGITFDNTDYTDVDVGFLPDGGITTAKLADGAVTTIKIGDSQVTDAKLAGISDRAKLPSALAYEDEANTFSANQRINAGLGVNIAPPSTGDFAISGRMTSGTVPHGRYLERQYTTTTISFSSVAVGDIVVVNAQFNLIKDGTAGRVLIQLTKGGTAGSVDEPVGGAGKYMVASEEWDGTITQIIRVTVAGTLTVTFASVFYAAGSGTFLNNGISATRYIA